MTVVLELKHDGKPERFDGSVNVVLKKTGGSWKIIALSWSTKSNPHTRRAGAAPAPTWPSQCAGVNVIGVLEALWRASFRRGSSLAIHVATEPSNCRLPPLCVTSVIAMPL